MNFIILDLEWNNAYSRKHKSFINEIIEIGAVMLDEELTVTDTFSMFIKAQLGKKLHSRVKELTNISNADISGGLPFSQVMSEFRRWSAGNDNLVLTWGDTDLRVLIENFRYFNGISFIPFLNNYANLQKYTQAFLDITDADQLGLQNAAEMLGINTSTYSLHRAIDDSILTAEILRSIYNPQMLESYSRTCDEGFYNRLLFRARAITNLNSPLIDKGEMVCFCERCSVEAERITDWRLINQSFRANFKCPVCARTMRYTVRFKEYFDRIDVKSSTVPYIEKKEPSEEAEAAAE